MDKKITCIKDKITPFIYLTFKVFTLEGQLPNYRFESFWFKKSIKYKKKKWNAT